jgi:hypothetical protein
MHGFGWSLRLLLPPLATLIFAFDPNCNQTHLASP